VSGSWRNGVGCKCRGWATTVAWYRPTQRRAAISVISIELKPDAPAISIIFLIALCVADCRVRPKAVHLTGFAM
jgi:hypothetical protein